LNQAKSIDQALAEAFLKADQLAAPLDQRLKLYLGESRALLPDLESTYDQLVARIAANIRDSNQVSQVGEVLPNFCMTDSDGKARRPCRAAGPWPARDQLQSRPLVRLLWARAALPRSRLPRNF
jgi:hypothetical protein